MGFISCTHHSVWRAKNALQLRYRDLLRFKFGKLRKTFVMCIDESIEWRCVGIALEAKW